LKKNLLCRYKVVIIFLTLDTNEVDDKNNFTVVFIKGVTVKSYWFESRPFAVFSEQQTGWPCALTLVRKRLCAV
jgi:hypothetical protein